VGLAPPSGKTLMLGGLLLLGEHPAASKRCRSSRIAATVSTTARAGDRRPAPFRPPARAEDAAQGRIVVMRSIRLASVETRALRVLIAPCALRRTALGRRSRRCFHASRAGLPREAGRVRTAAGNRSVARAARSRLAHDARRVAPIGHFGGK
jgi:hypothetical protein